MARWFCCEQCDIIIRRQSFGFRCFFCWIVRKLTAHLLHTRLRRCSWCLRNANGSSINRTNSWRTWWCDCVDNCLQTVQCRHGRWPRIGRSLRLLVFSIAVLRWTQRRVAVSSMAVHIIGMFQLLLQIFQTFLCWRCSLFYSFYKPVNNTFNIIYTHQQNTKNYSLELELIDSRRCLPLSSISLNINVDVRIWHSVMLAGVCCVGMCHTDSPVFVLK